MIDFQLDASSGVATYLQLAQQVRHAVMVGVLRPGDRLPTAREVVASLAVNPNTVHKAYRELEREGLVGVRPGQGTFVLRDLPGPDPALRVRFSLSLVSWLAEARDAGFTPEDVEAIYRTAVRDCYTEGVA